MKPKFTYAIRPRLPEKLAFLGELAGNIWWEWHYDAIDLFRRISRHRWAESRGNPCHVLLHVEQERLNYLSREEGFLNHMQRVREAFNAYLTEPRWFQRVHGNRSDVRIAYFSAEYGLSSALPIYSGGLGILSGDHLKTASDMGLPLVAIGMAYRLGYFHQYLNIDGWQQERYDENDFYNLPMQKVLDDAGDWLTIDIPYLTRPVKVAIWRVNVGRVPLYLMSTNLPENRPEDRVITDQLYGGDKEMRIRQEIVLGIGGMVLLRRLGIKPTVYHMNEGHSAFMGLERVRLQMGEHNLDFNTAFEATYSNDCFTTHTPVPAGNDVFSLDALRKYLGPLATELALDWQKFAELGQGSDIAGSNDYCMTIAAIKTASCVNGVSRLHAHVSRGMWQQLWPELPRDEVPIRAVTNGIHLYSWISHDLASLLDRYIGPAWHDDPLLPELWNRIYEIPDEELWRTHERRRARLVAFARARLESQLAARGASIEEITGASEVLNPEALSIGFARRFATYKRGNLLFRDLERLKRLCADRDRPVQFLYAGKAHPRDDEGKKVIREIIHQAREEHLRFRVVFLEDYDIIVARYLVQGCDIWLNTPRRPQEASGTSGMKAVANGALHMSILDGWWDQAYHKDYGWAIGSGEEYDDIDYQDEVEGHAIYDLLEREAVPLFFKRSVAGIPREWVGMMKRSMANLIPRFSSHRMLFNYIDEAYLPADAANRELTADGYKRSRDLAGWRARVDANWKAVQIVNIEASQLDELIVGDRLQVRATVNTGKLSAADVRVEVFSGPVDSRRGFQNPQGTEMQLDPAGNGEHPVFVATLIAPQSGYFGFTVRVMPKHPDLRHKFAAYYLTWANGDE
ncbi:alpha-glucan family phosphorylase [bacterium]|nr:alpha-glucan family phosphorylase [bacterium]